MRGIMILVISGQFINVEITISMLYVVNELLADFDLSRSTCA
jgi:hypothetical protein